MNKFKVNDNWWHYSWSVIVDDSVAVKREREFQLSLTACYHVPFHKGIVKKANSMGIFRLVNQTNSIKAKFPFRFNTRWCGFIAAVQTACEQAHLRAATSKAIRQEWVWWRGTKKVSLHWFLSFFFISASPEQSEIPLTVHSYRKK